MSPTLLRTLAKSRFYMNRDMPNCKVHRSYERCTHTIGIPSIARIWFPVATADLHRIALRNMSDIRYPVTSLYSIKQIFNA